MTQPQPLAFVGFKLPSPMAAALKATAQMRGVTQSAVIRDALAKDLASVPNPKTPPNPAA